ncbi:tripartite tricarboxylate transporter permease [Celeribacter indicus]|uniref:Transmembrane protein n=1 Tax=Celeribacter indicus TaxID=1208324 RepID=A0A0B5E017_9RHOB|nr:tripartite tricarboxylate transporter permease [Celeribacter indicus]AJE46725.1 transmembrane protein [Celeribacter indicus]SDX04884.1 TctA family transporter [Celeribacter indicus]
MPELLQNLGLGLSTALEPINLLYCFGGVLLGTFIGIIPGIGPLTALSLLLPLTFYLDSTTAIIMMAGIYYGSAYGGSTASILLNLPGTASNAVACLDGHPMAKQGRAGVALFMSTIASFFGGCVSILVMVAFSSVIARLALQFGSPEYFGLMVLGLVSASTIGQGAPVKGIATVMLGILLGLVGMDLYSGAQRYTFGSVELLEGLSMVALAMGLFGVSELLSSIGTKSRDAKLKVTLRSMIPTREDVRRSWMPMVRGSGIGALLGVLPGAGPTVASFMSYAVEKKVAAEPERFGNGAIEGLVGPETTNNAAEQSAFIPTLTLGIPGSATMALILGVLMINGIQPGPAMMSTHPGMFWGLVMSFWIGNVLLLILNIPLIGIWVRVLSIPYHILYPAIIMFICMGAYSVHYSIFEVFTVLGFGILGYVLRLLHFSSAPLILGFILGPLLEDHFRRSLILSRGDLSVFVERPISLGFLLITLAILLVTAVLTYRNARRRRALAELT